MTAKMHQFDVVVIGGGVLGCFTARNLSRWKLKTALVEAEPDVCMGITRANAAVVYAGYDHKPDSAKATFTVQANADMQSLCQTLEVPFRRPGGLMTAVGPKGEAVLREKLGQGKAKAVPGLALLPGEEARALEPMLGQNVTLALYSPTTATVNPWQLCIAAFENALHNGCTPMLHTPVRGIRRSDGGYVLETDGEEIYTKAVLNCAGLYADRVRELLFPPEMRLKWDASDFLILDKNARAPSHILFQETEDGKGITAVPTTDGNLLLASPARPLTGEPFATTREGLRFLQERTLSLLPELDLGQTIRSFAAVRPNPRGKNGENIRSFVIDAPEPGFVSLIGVKTPGLTCADQLGMHLAKHAAQYLQAEENPSFDPIRRAICSNREDPAYWDILCQCQRITRGEIEEAIARGATTLDGIKHRLGTGMGICQGSRCELEIEKLLHKKGI